MYFLGIDPGNDGALAFFDPETHELIAYTMPKTTRKIGGTRPPKIKGGKRRPPKTKTEVNPVLVASILAAHRVTFGVIEQVGARPDQGVTSMFNFGRSYGMAEGATAALAIPYAKATPQAWRGRMRVPRGKDGSHERFGQLFPGVKFWKGSKAQREGMVEASLIAYYAWVSYMTD